MIGSSADFFFQWPPFFTLLKEHNSLKNEIDNERALYLDKRIELRLMEEGLSGVDMAVVRGI